MKRLTLSVLLLTLVPLVMSNSAVAESKKTQHKAHHIVIIWLKQHGNESMRRQYIKASKRLAKLPGVLAYNIGTVAAVKRDSSVHALDDSYDIAISSTFENQQALENYLNHPEHNKIIQNALKPLVDKYKIYDFVE
ncbi:stress protein [Methyloprofundus sedimenti]|uniref:Stress protein n=1 Tax=Methyloprofundus sedimenti TaxID=1420851 RepID=A0A1V8M5V3_9GAMM|nr:Dabb family protein [Methyloprofundus sedimenti]OQK16876.1 stress protein [Methyloprofundus sedimenti]